MKYIQAFFCLLAVLVLSVLYVGLIVSALLSILSGILRTFGHEQIEMTIWQDVPLPILLSIPFSFLVALLLYFCSLYVKHGIKLCLTKL